jgi:hypothetical protein
MHQLPVLDSKAFEVQETECSELNGTRNAWPRGGSLFTVFFCGRLNFASKLRDSAQRLRTLIRQTPSLGNAVQSSETMRNSLGLNYKSAVYQLSELCRRCPYESRFSEFIKSSFESYG